MPEIKIPLYSLNTDVEVFKKNARKLNPQLQLFEISATQATCMNLWCAWLAEECAKCK